MTVSTTSSSREPASDDAAITTAAMVGPGGPGMTWMLSVGAVDRIEQAGLPSDLLAADFDQPSTILLGATGPGGDPSVPRARAAADFTSAATLVRALADHQLPASVPYVVLDLEDWPLTPVTEQHDPIGAAEQAARAARAAGKQLVFTPAVNLVRVLTGERLTGSALASAYDRLLAEPGARLSDVFEVQAQGTEGRATSASFVASAVGAARAAHPGMPVLVGLSTNPSGRRVTPADLLQLAQAGLEAGAGGFWLNVPEGGPACPRCGQAQPQVAVAFLEQFAPPVPPTALDAVRPRENPAGRADPAGARQ